MPASPEAALPSPTMPAHARASKPDGLRLIAFDADDLAVVSAYVQDAVARTGAIEWRPRHKRMTIPLHRYAWERGEAAKAGLRRLSILRIDRVEHVRSRAIDQAGLGAGGTGGTGGDDGDGAVVSLLALSFSPAGDGEAGGTLRIVCAGQAEMELRVEALEVRLADTDAAWSATGRPRHEDR